MRAHGVAQVPVGLKCQDKRLGSYLQDLDVYVGFQGAASSTPIHGSP
jgi:hypothetical protein